jgi:hypothetical protein
VKLPTRLVYSDTSTEVFDPWCLRCRDKKPEPQRHLCKACRLFFLNQNQRPRRAWPAR